MMPVQTRPAPTGPRKWSFLFIDGNTEYPGPLLDAHICERLAEADAMVMFHNLVAPTVGQGLEYMRSKGWNTLIYQTAQMMGVAWRGNVKPVEHRPDPRVNWPPLPAHLRSFPVSGGG